MTLLELLLLIYAAAGVLLLAAWRRPGRSLWRWIAIAGAVLTAAVVTEGRHRPEALPMTLVAFIIAALAFRRSRWQSPPLPGRRRILAAGLRYVAAMLLAIVVVGVVIDVRGNPGGADKLVPRIMGFFVDERQFYGHTTYYDESTSRFERQDVLTLWTEPREPHFAGPIAVLVDEWCVSACEGIALIARKRAGGHVVGFHGTSGSFGMSGAEVLMPGGLTIEYPHGQSLDENGVVQLDGDWRFEGGVTPDIRVPLTMDTVRAQFKDGHDVVLETAVRTLNARSRE